MALLTAAEVQALGVGGDLAAADLQDIIDREEAEMIRRYGAHTASITESVRPNGRSVYLKRAVSSVTSVAEALYLGDASPVTRAATDYVIWSEEGRLERAADGAGWGAMVTVVYTPVDGTNLRTMVLLELVKIAVSQGGGGGANETIREGDVSYAASGGMAADYAAARAAQYARLGWLS